MDRLRSVVLAAVLAAVVSVLLAPLAPSVGAHPVDPDWVPPRAVYIPETGQTIDGVFLNHWRSGGGALPFGNPITPEITGSNGRIGQYYEYARFEYWPKGAANGQAVTLGRIGAELRPFVVRRSTPTGESIRQFQRGGGGTDEALAIAGAWLPTEADEVPADALDWRHVPETGQGVWGAFRSLWEATGEAAYFGNPLTREYDVDGVTYQVFERGQLAWEPGRDAWMVPVGELLTERYGLDTSPVEQGDIPTYSEELFVPPAAVPDAAAAPAPVPGAPKSIVVSLEQQAMWADEGDRIVLRTYVSTGRGAVRDAARPVLRQQQATRAGQGGRHRRRIVQRAAGSRRHVLPRPRPRHPRHLLARQLRHPDEPRLHQPADGRFQATLRLGLVGTPVLIVP